MQTTSIKRTSGLHSSGCNCASCRQNASNKTIMDEILQETSKLSAGDSGCGCHQCTQRKESELIQNEIQRQGGHLSEEQELELGKALQKIKEYAKKGIAIGDIIRRILVPGTDMDAARFYEEQRRRQAAAAVEQADPGRRDKMVIKPDKEIPLIQEILMELELPKKYDGTKLTRGEKRSLRDQATRGRDKIPEWVARCKEIERRTGKRCEVDHAIPLQYTHLFKQNPNKGNNLLLLTQQQHSKIHKQLNAALLEAKKNVFKKHAERYAPIKRDLDIERRKVLVRFKKLLLEKHGNAAVPKHLKNQVIKEILHELELSGISLKGV